MRVGRPIAYVAVFVAAVVAGWWFFGHREPAVGDHVTVYYTKLDGATEVPWTVSLGPARDLHSVAFYAAAQTVAGPPSGVEAVRFPDGTRVLSVTVAPPTIDVNLSQDVDALANGSFAEAAAFKSLVWTLTDARTFNGINSVTIRIAGARVPTLPGGHFELDEPLSRSSW